MSWREHISPVYINTLKFAAEYRLTLEEIEFQADLPKGTIESWERRKPELIELFKVAGVFGKEPSDFIGI